MASAPEPAPSDLTPEESATGSEATLWWPVVAPAAALLLLGVAALVLTRRRRTRASPLELVGTLSLGPRRQLVLARFGTEELLLGSSEAGIQLLVRRSTVTAQGAAHGTDDVWLTRLATEEPQGGLGGGEPAPLGGAAYAASAEVASPGTPFEAVLDDSIEDQTLRQKLSAGLGGRRS